jgi:ATPase subunit of ABC transporter with duplicated ATPase domains
LYREDGKRYKLKSLKVMDAKAVRLPARAEPVKVGKEITLRLPAEAVSAEINTSGSGGMPLIVVEGLSFSYAGAPAPILKNITCSICPGDRIALVGKNGAGKSTLIRALMGSSDVVVAGGRAGQGSVHRRGKVSLLDQNQIATLAEHLEESSVEFLAKRHPQVAGVGRFKVDGDIRAHLGGFGLSGETALLPISELSGGLRVRLCLADLFAPLAVPDVLLLDEPTNHLDAETTTALVNALKTFKGAVVVVSHNFGFLLNVCRDLWVCEAGSLKIIRHTNENDFSHHFRQFASQIISKDDRADLDNVLRNRATRNALVVQGPGSQQASLIL